MLSSVTHVNISQHAHFGQRYAFQGRFLPGPSPGRHRVTRYKLHCNIEAQRSWAADQHRVVLMFGLCWSPLLQQWHGELW